MFREENTYSIFFTQNVALSLTIRQMKKTREMSFKRKVENWGLLFALFENRK